MNRQPKQVRLALALLISVGSVTAPGYAQKFSVEVPAPSPLVSSAGHKLQLTWPETRLRFSVSGVEDPLHANGTLHLFRAESVWLDTHSLQLLTTGKAERAFELDCRLTCQPIVSRGLELEARFKLHSGKENWEVPHAFVRTSSAYTTQSTTFRSLVSVGIAGALNF